MSEQQEWVPKTELGKKVKSGAIATMQEVFSGGHIILEAEVIDALLPDATHDLLMIGQAKGKFGGGQRRVFKQTQKKTKEGNKPSFTTYAVIGNKNGYVGLGVGKAKETVPAREKAVRRAKLNMIQIARGAGDWESETKVPHTIPFEVTGKSGSVEMTLIPAPLGTGLVVEKECQKILELAGIRDCRAQTRGHTATKVNVIKACFDALQKLSEFKVRAGDMERLGIVYGPIEQQGESNE
ncbi:MAG: 30S ribosomal protein S5 [Candidatus Woesearchaeota archaeon]